MLLCNKSLIRKPSSATRFDRSTRFLFVQGCLWLLLIRGNLWNYSLTRPIINTVKAIQKKTFFMGRTNNLLETSVTRAEQPQDCSGANRTSKTFDAKPSTQQTNTARTVAEFPNVCISSSLSFPKTVQRQLLPIGLGRICISSRASPSLNSSRSLSKALLPYDRRQRSPFAN